MYFYNSLTRRREEFNPVTKGHVKLYTCGPTVYNYPHIGNYRAYVFEDLLRRALAYSGYGITQVMNITDVDDKTIRDSQASGTSLTEFTETYKKAFFEDIKTLRLEEAEYYPAATEHVEDMIELIRTLMDKGYAYQAEDGSVYFSIRKFPHYGQLVPVDLDNLQSTERVKNDEYEKESAADFALWKAHTSDDGDVYWESPWGPGRPGWHIECSAMSMRYLGKSFDIHTGGSDNMFPHHEDEIAQSEAANECKFVNYWLHCAHLLVDNKKMSKSLGNFYTLRDLLDKGFTGRELRWVLMNAHYRQTLNFTLEGCRDARHTLQRIDDFIARLKQTEDAGVAEAQNSDVDTLLSDAENDFKAGLEDDLNISHACAALFTFIRNVNKRLDNEQISSEEATQSLDLLRKFDNVLGCLDVDRTEGVPDDVQERAERRQEARKNKDFATADAIRDELYAEGWVVEDTPSGPRVKRADDAATEA